MSNNTEKILHQVLSKLDSLEDGQKEMKADISGLKADVSALKNDMADVKRKLNSNSEYEHTATSLEFRTYVEEKLKEHDIDIKLLKKIIAK